ncbi:MAG: restriction endonuclease subunit S [Anaerolineae bacterium]
MGGEWTTPIEELIDTGDLVINDGYRAKNSELSTDGLPFARAQNINNGFHFENADCFPELGLDKVGIKISQPGDVVFTSKGTVGRFAFVREDTPRFVYAPQLCFWRSLNHKKIHPRWLYYWMQSREFFVQYSGVAGQTDMAEYVSLRDQRRMHITLPPLPEQRAIAHILGTLDDKIELNRQMNQTLEAIARALFKSWFVDFDPVRAKAEGGRMKDEIADLFPDEFVDSELGEIPKGWAIGTLGDVATHPRRGIQPNDIEPSTPYIALEHMPRHCIALTDWGTADDLQSNKFEFKKGEILFGKLRPYFHKVGVAPLNGVCSTDIVVITPLTENWFGFVLGHVSSSVFVKYTNAGSTGTKMPRTSWNEMARYAVVMPPETVAEAFTRQVRPLVDRIIAAIHESRTLAALRDTLLPKLISGELRVPEKMTQDLQDSQDLQDKKSC